MRLYGLLILFCLLLFGYSWVGGRPLTMHEARLPETSREMRQNFAAVRPAGNTDSAASAAPTASSRLKALIVPMSGDRPWVERPPLPHWLTIALTAPLGGLDAVWKARVPNVIMATLCVLMLCAIIERLFDRRAAILAGFLQATTYEFLCYAWLAEDDIYLCTVIYAVMLCFVVLENPVRRQENAAAVDDNSAGRKSAFFGKRSFGLLSLFVLLGLANMTKGMVFGTVLALIPIAGSLLVNFRWDNLRRYLWFPGWLIFLAVAAWWAVAAEILAPGSWKIWHYDLYGRLAQGYLGQPWHYYLTHFPGIMAPWFPLGFVGLFVLWRRGNFAGEEKAKNFRRAVFATCWAVLPILVLSVSRGKHHHYLLSVTGAWAMLGALGLRQAAAWVANWKPAWEQRFGKFLAVALIAVSVGYALIHSLIFTRTDRTAEDTAFLRQAEKILPPGGRLFVDALSGMDFFRNAFYLQKFDPLVISNVTFIADSRYKLPGKEIWVITRAREAKRLQKTGEVAEVLRSANSRRAATPEENWTLFRVKVSKDLPQVDFPQGVTPMQAMERDKIPELM